MKRGLVPFRKRSMQSSRGWFEHPFDRLSREMDELFNLYYGGRFNASSIASKEFGVELSESDDDIVVSADLPGMKAGDIQVSLEGDILTIRALRKEKKEKRRRNYKISETRYGGVSRTIRLPAQVDCEKAETKFKRGVLTLRLPKTDEAKKNRLRIPVSAG